MSGKYDDGSKYWRDAATNQGKPAASGSKKRQGMDSVLEPSEGTSPANTLILAPQDLFQILTAKTVTG